MGYFYHYCSLDTFNAILSSKAFRLSDLSKTNDYTERKWVLNIIEEALIEYLEEEKLKFNLREQISYTDNIISHLEYLISDINIYVEQSSFITCFSKNGDLLSQWRAYADNGMGISIGFNKELLNKVSKRNSVVSIEHVLYEREAQIEEIKYCAEVAMVDFLGPLFHKRNDKEFLSHFMKEEFEGFSECFSSYIANCSCFIKNPAFIEEDEVRIFYAPFIHENNDIKDLVDLMNTMKKFNMFDLSTIEFSIRNNQVVGYVDLSFKRLIDRGIIQEIIIGPSSRATEKDIRFLLIKHGFDNTDIKIKKSTATYQIK